MMSYIKVTKRKYGSKNKRFKTGYVRDHGLSPERSFLPSPSRISFIPSFLEDESPTRKEHTEKDRGEEEKEKKRELKREHNREFKESSLVTSKENIRKSRGPRKWSGSDDILPIITSPILTSKKILPKRSTQKTGIHVNEETNDNFVSSTIEISSAITTQPDKKNNNSHNISLAELGPLFNEKPKTDVKIDHSDLPSPEKDTDVSTSKNSKARKKSLRVSFAEEVTFLGPDDSDSLDATKSSSLGEELDVWNLLGGLSEKLSSNSVMNVSSTLSSFDESSYSEIESTDEDEAQVDFQDRSVISMISQVFSESTMNVDSNSEDHPKTLIQASVESSQMPSVNKSKESKRSKIQQEFEFLQSNFIESANIHIKRSTLLDLCSHIISTDRTETSFLSYIKSVDLSHRFYREFSENSSDPLYQFCFGIVFTEVFSDSSKTLSSLAKDQEKISLIRAILIEMIQNDKPIVALINDITPKLSKISLATLKEVVAKLNKAYSSTSQIQFTSQTFAVAILKKMNSITNSDLSMKLKAINFEKIVISSIFEMVPRLSERLSSSCSDYLVKNISSHETVELLLVMNELQEILNFNAEVVDSSNNKVNVSIAVADFIGNHKVTFAKVLKSLFPLELAVQDVLKSLSSVCFNNQNNQHMLLLLNCYITSLQVRILAASNYHRIIDDDSTKTSIDNEIFRLIHSPEVTSSFMKSLNTIQKFIDNTQDEKTASLVSTIELFSLGYIVNVMEDSICFAELLDDDNVSILSTVLHKQQTKEISHSSGYYGLLAGSILVADQENQRVSEQFGQCHEFIKASLKNLNALVDSSNFDNVKNQIQMVLQNL